MRDRRDIVGSIPDASVGTPTETSELIIFIYKRKSRYYLLSGFRL